MTRLAGNVIGRLVIVTAEKIPSSELIDTTGAGDAFTGALLYGNTLHYIYQVLTKCIKPNVADYNLQSCSSLLTGLCTDMATEETLTFASQVVS